MGLVLRRHAEEAAHSSDLRMGDVVQRHVVLEEGSKTQNLVGADKAFGAVLQRFKDRL